MIQTTQPLVQGNEDSKFVQLTKEGVGYYTVTSEDKLFGTAKTIEKIQAWAAQWAERWAKTWHK